METGHVPFLPFRCLGLRRTPPESNKQAAEPLHEKLFSLETTRPPLPSCEKFAGLLCHPEGEKETDEDLETECGSSVWGELDRTFSVGSLTSTPWPSPEVPQLHLGPSRSRAGSEDEGQLEPEQMTPAPAHLQPDEQEAKAQSEEEARTVVAPGPTMKSWGLVGRSLAGIFKAEKDALGPEQPLPTAVEEQQEPICTSNWKEVGSGLAKVLREMSEAELFEEDSPEEKPFEDSAEEDYCDARSEESLAAEKVVRTKNWREVGSGLAKIFRDMSEAEAFGDSPEKPVEDSAPEDHFDAARSEESLAAKKCADNWTQVGSALAKVFREMSEAEAFGESPAKPFEHSVKEEEEEYFDAHSEESLLPSPRAPPPAAGRVLPRRVLKTGRDPSNTLPAGPGTKTRPLVPRLSLPPQGCHDDDESEEEKAKEEPSLKEEEVGKENWRAVGKGLASIFAAEALACNDGLSDDGLSD